ncbi:MAG: YncE family protein [Patescibacteria group bacterium]
MKKVLIFTLVIVGIVSIGVWYRYGRSENIMEKIYVAAEGDGAINIIDSATRQVIRTVDLSVGHEGGIVKFHPHNVVVAPDGKSVWITANAGKHEGHSQGLVNSAYAHGANESGVEPDEVIVLDPWSRDEIINRIETDIGAQLAHVAVSADGSYAYVTAQKRGVVYKIDAKSKKIISEVSFAIGSEPHGLRISSDGARAFIAVLKGKALGILDLSKNTMTMTSVSLRGAAVQVGITPDGKYAVASLYDTKELAVYDTQSGAVSYIALPASSKGPIQMYSTPDSKFFYLADQGYYFSQPTSEWVYKIDIENRTVIKEIKAGQAPHGVVVSKDGKFAYITNLLSNDVSVIDAVADTEVARVPVGKEPNGISIWNRDIGGTP